MDVVQATVPCLGHHGKTVPRPRHALLDHAPMKPFDCGIADGAHAHGIGQQNRSEQQSGFLNRLGAGHLSRAIERKDPGGNAVADLTTKGENGGNAGSHRSVFVLCHAVAGNHGRMADTNPDNVGDRVPAARRAIKRHPQLSRARR